MLLALKITNFAIIDDCDLTFEDGLIALTGETGAGKSIVIDALSVCLGARVGVDAIRHGEETCRIEAAFALSNPSPEVTALLVDQGLERADDMLILSRELRANGRGIARVNGHPVPLSFLSALGGYLVDLHGQSEHLSLLKHGRQLDMLDHFARTDGLRETFATQAADVFKRRNQLTDLIGGQRAAEQRLDLLRFQVSEIRNCDLQPGEQRELERERVRLANAEKLVALATQSIETLRGDDLRPGAVDLLTECAGVLDSLCRIDESHQETRTAAGEVLFAAEDLAATLRHYRDAIEFDPPRLAEVESRLDEISRLRRKYGETIEEILEFAETAERDLQAIENFDDRVTELREELATKERLAANTGEHLARERREASRRLRERVHERLLQLGLGPAHFEIELEPLTSETGIEATINDQTARYAFTSSGLDRIRFLVAFNPGEPLRPVERVASGGETARLMLALKAALAEADDVPTLVFDEIDTGVGGRGAGVIGAMLRELAQSHQVITITHLPQIAALASEHIKIVKRTETDRTGIRAIVLDGDPRLHELAEMLAGASPSETAIRSAAELLTPAESLN